MQKIILIDLYACKQKACSYSRCFEVDGNCIYSPKFVTACFQRTLGHCAVGSLTSGMGVGIEVLQPAGTR